VHHAGAGGNARCDALDPVIPILRYERVNPITVVPIESPKGRAVFVMGGSGNGPWNLICGIIANKFAMAFYDDYRDGRCDEEISYSMSMALVVNLFTA
jgi:hypothetical protein